MIFLVLFPFFALIFSSHSIHPLVLHLLCSSLPIAIPISQNCLQFLMLSTTMALEQCEFEIWLHLAFFCPLTRSWAHKKNQIKQEQKKEQASKQKKPPRTKCSKSTDTHKKHEKQRIKTMKIKFKLTLVHIKNYYFRMILLAHCTTLLLSSSLSVLFLLHFCIRTAWKQMPTKKLNIIICNQNHKIWTGIRDLSS